MKADDSIIMVAIVGGSGSGKTWLAKRLVEALGNGTLSFSLDDFYRDQSGLSPEARESLNFDLPNAIEWDLLKDALHRCRRGAPLSIPRYDFEAHCRGKKPIPFIPASIVIVEGLWLLYHPEVRRLFDLTLYLECPVELRMRRRILRDRTERGRTLEASERSFRETVNVMHGIHIVPQKHRAQKIVNCPIGAAEVASLGQLIRAAHEAGSSH